MSFRFEMNWKKAVEAVHYVASIHDGITPYYLAKIFFYADKEHMADWGRSICGDFYVAMENGPVPSNIYNLVKRDPFIEEGIISDFDARVQKDDLAMHSKRKFEQVTLSKTDMDYLKSAAEKYGRMNFGELRDKVHKEKAWLKAWQTRVTAAPRMDMDDMIDEEIDNRKELIEEISRKSVYAG